MFKLHKKLADFTAISCDLLCLVVSIFRSSSLAPRRSLFDGTRSTKLMSVSEWTRVRARARSLASKRKPKDHTIVRVCHLRGQVMHVTSAMLSGCGCTERKKKCYARKKMKVTMYLDCGDPQMLSVTEGTQTPSNTAIFPRPNHR